MILIIKYLFTISAIVLSFQVCSADDENLRVKFTSEDIKVLKEVARLDKVSKAGAKIILSSPVISLISSPDPMDVVITITTTDFGDIYKAAANMKKIGACEIYTSLFMHADRSTNDRPPTGNSKKYFDKLVKLYENKCHN